MQEQLQRFHVRNEGDMVVGLSWKTPAPFRIHPHSASELQPGETRHFTAHFVARNASVYTAAAVCTLSDGISNSVKLTAIGKFPCLALSNAAIEHGNVLAGQTARATTQLHNQSLVPARFTIRRSDTHDDSVFAVTPATGVIPPGGSTDLAARFKPQFAGTFSSLAFDITTAGGNAVALWQRGAARGAEVALSAKCLDFGDVPLGKSVKKVSLNA